MDNLNHDAMVHCCADCGSVAREGFTLKACKSCMLVRYCNVNCQKNHWSTHKTLCKRRSAELRDEALFKDPPAKKDCPICFLPVPTKAISCVSLPPATISSVPIKDFVNEHEELATHNMEYYYSCCGKSICGGCAYSFRESENNRSCPFCKTDRIGKTDKERVKQMMKRVEANDAGAIYALGSNYFHGKLGLHQDRDKAMELWKQAAKMGFSKAHFALGTEFYDGGDLKKAKFHYEEAAMAGHEDARFNLGIIEGRSGNVERGFKHWIIAASAGDCNAMYNLQQAFEKGYSVSEETINSTLAAYNTSCAEMRSETRDIFITDHTVER